MKYSVVNFLELDQGSMRIDPDYYDPDNFLLLAQLKSKKYCQLGDIAFITDGIHSSIDFDSTSNINLISAKAPKGNYFDLSNTGFISNNQDSINKKTRLIEGDVVISTVGTIGNCAVVDQSILPANADRHVGIIRPKKDFLPYFISTFLLSKYGRFQSLRESTGNVQLNLFIYKIKEIFIPLLSFGFQELIQKICVAANILLSDSKLFYLEAEQLVLNALGLSDFLPSHHLFFISNFSATTKAGRFDAEFFQPKYDDLISIIKQSNFPYCKLSDLVKIRKGVEPGSYYYQEEGIPFIRVSNLTKYGLTNNNQQYLSIDIYNQFKLHQPKKGDILLSKDASPGVAFYLFDEPGNMIISSGILRLTVKSFQVTPEYLYVLLNSIVVQIQIDRDSAGSVISHWRPHQVDETFIPILNSDKQQQISDLVSKSNNNKKLSYKMFDIAKHCVEMAIDTNENNAELWLKEKINELGLQLEV